MRKIKKTIIVDLDGTLAIFKGVRDGLDFIDVSRDKVNGMVREVINMLSKKYTIVVLSGRPLSCYVQSKEWLGKNKIHYDFMFFTGGEKSDREAKKEVYFKTIKPMAEVKLVIEDRNSVVEMWRELGLTCWQVAKTDY